MKERKSMRKKYFFISIQFGNQDTSENISFDIMEMLIILIHV